MRIIFKELEGKKTPEYDRHLFYRLYMKFRNCLAKKEYPIFKNILIEISRSNINGIGVFATQRIEAKSVVADGINEEDYCDLVSWESTKDISPPIKKKISDFCIGTPSKFIPPEENNFNKLSIEWYINYFCNGNIGFNEDGNFVAIRNIEQDEELTYDYGLAESNPKFTMQCDCKSNNCRHVITGNDWKDHEFRKKNKNYTLPKLRQEEF
jgi:SET domain-containing protein